MTTGENVLGIDGPGELLETLPYLLGFHPGESVVLVGLDSTQLVVTARIDLSAAVDPETVDDAVRILVRARASAAIVVVYAGAADRPMRAARASSRLPYARRTEQIATTLAAVGLRVLDSLFVQDGYWWSYPGRASGCACCVMGTRLPGDAASGPAAAVFAGLQALPDRQALEAVLDAEPDEVRDQHHAGIEAVENAAARSAVNGQLLREQRSVKRAVFAAAREADGALFPRATLDFAESTLCRFAVALSDTAVRDAVWLAVDQERLDGRALWLYLLQRLPAPYDSAPLFLFGWATWRDGNGTLAAIAAERALVSDPGYTAAELLLSAVRQGLDPFRTPRLRASGRRGSPGRLIAPDS